MKTLPVKCETVGATGKVEKTETVNFGILPPKAGVCAFCATDHTSDLPHNAQSLYYQYTFYGEHGRWPTWADAVAHCTEEMRAVWTKELKRLNAWSEPEGEPISQPYAEQK